MVRPFLSVVLAGFSARVTDPCARSDVRAKVEGEGALYQAFRSGTAARRWFRRTRHFRQDFDTQPFDVNALGGAGPAPPS